MLALLLSTAVLPETEIKLPQVLQCQLMAANGRPIAIAFETSGIGSPVETSDDYLWKLGSPTAAAEKFGKRGGTRTVRYAFRADNGAAVVELLVDAKGAAPFRTYLWDRDDVQAALPVAIGYCSEDFPRAEGTRRVQPSLNELRSATPENGCAVIASDGRTTTVERDYVKPESNPSLTSLVLTPKDNHIWNFASISLERYKSPAKGPYWTSMIFGSKDVRAPTGSEDLYADQTNSRAALLLNFWRTDASPNSLQAVGHCGTVRNAQVETIK